MSRASARYRLYGLTVRSPLLLPGLRAQSVGPVDVQLKVGDASRFKPARAAIGPGPSTRTWFRSHRLTDGTTYLRWRGLFEFLISPDGRQIHYRRLKHATRESFSVYLLGQVLSCSLVAFGIEPLHGTVVVIHGEAIALVGDCGYGKSTLAAALLARGFRILTDDVITLEERRARWMVHPGMPRLKLFPSVARKLLGASLHGTPMNHKTAKLVLPLGAGQAACRPVPLKVLYVLSDPTKCRRESGPVRAEPLAGGDAFLELIRAAFNLFIFERKRLETQFAFATRLAAAVPVRRLTFSRTLSALPAVCDALLTDLAR